MPEYIPDMVDCFNEYDARQQRELQRLPKCVYCGEPIQSDFYYDINDECICEECLNDNFKKHVEDYPD